jgi:hypothetical protein
MHLPKCHKNDQINFVTKINNFLAQFEGETLILGGDLNLYINPILDKKDTMTNHHDNHIYRQNIISLMETHCLTDCFRDLNPNLRRYTWHSRGKASRLDYFLISDYLLNEIITCKIDPGLHSDHSIFKLAIGNNDISRGKNLWKFNNSLLHDQSYVTEIKTIIKNEKEKHSKMTDHGLKWEVIKMEIRSFTLPCCVKKKKTRNALKKTLETELEKIQKLVDLNPSTINLETFEHNKKELEQIERDELNSIIFRSKIQWAEQGEKNKKFFMNLEKRNYINKRITQLNINGQIINDPLEIAAEQRTFYKNLYSEKI